MSSRQSFLRFRASALVLSIAALASPVAAGAAPLKVVASFSILADMVANVGGDDIALATIVGPDGDAHAFEPTPREARALGDAQVLFVNGLEFEGWLPRLREAAGFKGTEVVVSQGVVPLAFGGEAEHAHADHDHDHDHDHGHAQESAKAAAHDHSHAHAPAQLQGHGHSHDHGHEATARSGHAHDHAMQSADDAHDGHQHDHAHGSQDPHAWQDMANAEIYVNNIAQGLAAADPANAEAYRARAQAYLGQVRALDVQIKTDLGRIPAERRKVVTSHEAFNYFGRAYGVTFLSAVGISSQAEPSAGQVARLIDQVRKESIAAVFVENITNPRLIEQIARETGAKVGGTLYSDALSAKGKGADTYLGMMRWNAEQLIRVLQ